MSTPIHAPPGVIGAIIVVFTMISALASRTRLRLGSVSVASPGPAAEG